MAFLTGQTWYCGSTKYSSVAAWAATTSYPAGSLVRQLATPAVGSERVFVQTAATAPISGASEPSWTLTQGAKTTDGTCTWVEITGKAGVNGDITNSTAWLGVKNTAISQGVLIYDSVSGALQLCTTAGTTGNGSAPTFSATAGTTTADNTAVWTSLGAHGNFGAYAAPWARLALAWASGFFAANNDVVYVSNNHAETSSANINYNQNFGDSNSLAVICVSDTAVPPTATAITGSVTATGNSNIALPNGGSMYTYGIVFNCGTSTNNPAISCSGTNSNFDTCALNIVATGVQNTGNIQLVGGSGGDDGGNAEDPTGVILINCTVSFGASGQFFSGYQGSGFVMKGGSIGATGVAPSTLVTGNFGPGAMRMNFRDVNMSNFTGTILNAGSVTGGTIQLENCSMGAGFSMYTGTPPYTQAQTPEVKLHNCDSAGTNYRYGYQNNKGQVTSNTAITRTGGATNGTTGLSWKFVSSSIVNYYNAFQSEAIAVWNSFTSGTHTATIGITTNTALTNANLWIEVECLGASGSPLGSITNSKKLLLASAVALPTDGTSVWGGTAQTYQYAVACSFSPLQAGPLKVRIYLADPSVTVYVDPLIQLA